MNDFYADTHSEDLRFGDVIRGFPITTPITHDKDPLGRITQYNIQIKSPLHLVVMTPCCAIESHSIILAPLQEVKSPFFRNPFFEEDFTRINRKVPPDKAVAPEDWLRVKEEEKSKRLAIGDEYALLEIFIYKDHLALPKYSVMKKTSKEKVEVKTGCYMIDFKTLYRVECDLVKKPAIPPAGMKVLELTIQTRKLLREKLSYFFGRPEPSDIIELSS